MVRQDHVSANTPRRYQRCLQLRLIINDTLPR